MTNHPLAWTAPQPFWRAGVTAADARGAIGRPQILRFANDEFIEELLATLERNPGALVGYAAAPETWREPMGGPKTDPSLWLDRQPARLLPLLRRRNAKSAPVAVPLPKPLKLYQPAHQRHYLVAASLVCQAAGLPDRAIDPARQRVSFVVRRLFPKKGSVADLQNAAPTALEQWDENAWVPGGKSGAWQRVGDASVESALAKVFAGEERLALFPAKYLQTDDQRRRLFVGSVPVGRRETYQAGEQLAAPRSDAQAATQARVVQFQADVLGPWRALVNRARALDGLAPLTIFQKTEFDANGAFLHPDKRDPLDLSIVDADLLRALRSQLQLSAWYLLLDLRKYLERYLHDYLAWIDGGQAGAAPAGLADFHAALASVATPAAATTTGTLPFFEGSDFGSGDVAPDLPTAIARIGGFEDLLENALSGKAGYATRPFDLTPVSPSEAALWPDFLFLFVDPAHDVPLPVPGAPPNDAGDFGAEKLQAQIDALAGLLPGELLASDKPPPEPTLASVAPTDMREAWYVMRLAYERPECAPFEGNIVSRATVPFQMAGFFDPDAPARPIRIGLPVDLSPAGLRKFDKNAVLMMSDMLCGHIDRFKGITLADIVLSVLPWPFHKDLSVPDKGPCKQDGLSLGVMCSLSIPIITICALILLMIIVSLLDFIFHWLPFFVVCFPLPGFKGKKP